MLKQNDVGIRSLKDSFSIKQPSLPIDGKWFHMRWYAHILNSCVYDGLKPIVSISNRVTDVTKYIGLLEGCRRKWGEVIALLPKKQKMIPNVFTRWKTTYYMLYCAL